MIETGWGRALVGSRASRAAYASLKCVCFCYLGMLLPMAHLPVGWLAPKREVCFCAPGHFLVWATAIFCVFRAMPVVWDGRRYLATLKDSQCGVAGGRGDSVNEPQQRSPRFSIWTARWFRAPSLGMAFFLYILIAQRQLRTLGASGDGLYARRRRTAVEFRGEQNLSRQAFRSFSGGGAGRSRSFRRSRIAWGPAIYFADGLARIAWHQSQNHRVLSGQWHFAPLASAVLLSCPAKLAVMATDLAACATAILYNRRRLVRRTRGRAHGRLRQIARDAEFWRTKHQLDLGLRTPTAIRWPIARCWNAVAIRKPSILRDGMARVARRAWLGDVITGSGKRSSYCKPGETRPNHPRRETRGGGGTFAMIKITIGAGYEELRTLQIPARIPWLPTIRPNLPAASTADELASASGRRFLSCFASFGPFEWVTFTYLAWMEGLFCSSSIGRWPMRRARRGASAIASGSLCWRGAQASLEPSAVQFLRHWYPLPLYIFFFEELQGLVHVIFPGWFDRWLIQFDFNLARYIRRSG